MANSYQTEDAQEDPRRALARRKLEAARAELAAKEAEKPRRQARRPAAAGPPMRLKDLAPSISPTVFVHAILLAIAVTLTALAAVFCYAIMLQAFVAGRVMTLPVGVLAAVTLSYASGCYLGVVESTSRGHTTVEDALEGNWQDWFWSLPMSLGMAALAGVLGYALSLVLPGNGWLIFGATMWALYPILQLSSLESGSPLTPISLPVLVSLVRRPLAWLAFYAVTAALAAVLVAVARAAWRDPPYVTMLIMGPLATAALLIYGWLMGQLARWISAQPASAEED